MKVTAEPVSRRANGDWCQPNAEYGAGAHNAVSIELDDYEEIATVDDLPSGDEKWPKCAVIGDTYKVGNKIVRMKKSLSGK